MMTDIFRAGGNLEVASAASRGRAKAACVALGEAP
jgi:hypothetical protein